MPAGMQEPGGFPQGLSWSWEMDFATLVDALGDRPSLDAGAPDAGGDGGPDGNAPNANGADANGADDGGPAGEAAVLAALEQGAERLPAGVVAVRVAERLAPGPDLVAWLETAPAGDLTDYDLPGAASSWRRVAAYAQARELAHVAQIASRAARRDKNIEVAADGRPARIPAAAAEVSLALTMTPYSAAAWTDLAVDLKWRLPATGAALAVGLIDLPRAKLIAEATGPLTDTTARAVEDRVLPTAGQHTTSMLRAALRRAVIALDPEGAQRRKEDAERRAKVSLYPEQEGTATLTAQGLPAISAAAAMARITAMARAMKSAGAGGGIDFLRAQVLTGLILGTLPLIPPPTGAPPDAGPSTSGDDPGAGPDGNPAGPDGDPEAPGGDPEAPGGDPEGPDDGPDGPSNGPEGPDGHSNGPGSGPSSGPDGPGGGPSTSPGAGPDPSRDGDPSGDADGGPWDGFPDPLDKDAPEDAGDDLTGPSLLTGKYRPDNSYRPGKGPPDDGWPGPRDEDWLETGPTQGWPGLPTSIPPGLAAPGAATSRPVPGLLDVTVPWQTLAGLSPEPGHLGRIGPVTAPDARYLADCAARDPATIWRIIVTNRSGQACAVTRLPQQRGSPADEPPAPGPGPGNGLVGRITLTIPEDILDELPPLPGPDPPPILLQALHHAAKALAHARVAAHADADAGGCAHLEASLAYRVPARLRDYITARDVTCRFTTCRQPVWQCDIDHNTPYHQGGRTCKCNNCGLCRTHHQIKQLPGWTLHQVSPGTFQWTTPGGRVYTATPDIHSL